MIIIKNNECYYGKVCVPQMRDFRRFRKRCVPKMQNCRREAPGRFFRVFERKSPGNPAGNTENTKEVQIKLK